MCRAFLISGFVIVGLVSSAAQPTFTPPSSWGPTTNGLRVAISSASSTLPAGGEAFWIALQNAGPTDFVVNLGYMLANGKAMFPAAVRLVLVDPAGGTRELQFSDRRFPGAAGRVDDLTVALKAGAIYAFPISLDQYVSAVERRPMLTPGRYRITARFEGYGANADNLDVKGVALLHFWKGSTESNVLDFTVAAPPPK
jgi:hypothetical protein